MDGHRRDIFNTIVSQLEKCPRSLIVIDDVQYVHSSTLMVLQQFMDDSVPYVVKRDGTRVYKNQALLGLISDFGREGRTVAMSYTELEALVQQHTQSLWDWDPKQTQLIQFTFPFVSLTDEDIQNIILHMAQTWLPQSPRFKARLSQLTISPDALVWIAQQVRKKYPLENGRGAKKWVTKELPPLVNKHLKQSVTSIQIKLNQMKTDLVFYATKPLKEL